MAIVESKSDSELPSALPSAFQKWRRNRSTLRTALRRQSSASPFEKLAEQGCRQSPAMIHQSHLMFTGLDPNSDSLPGSSSIRPGLSSCCGVTRSRSDCLGALGNVVRSASCFGRLHCKVEPIPSVQSRSVGLFWPALTVEYCPNVSRQFDTLVGRDFEVGTSSALCTGVTTHELWHLSCL